MRSDFELLIVTMKQDGFAKIAEMNINCDVIFANQYNSFKYQVKPFNAGHVAKMITTPTVGVGLNRNIALDFATSKFCLLGDDDMIYRTDLESVVVNEFKKYPNSDVIVFNVETIGNTTRKQIVYNKTHYLKPLERMPWGAVRIAFRLESLRKKRICFSQLFGGGSIYSCGEDSIFLKDLKRSGLRILVSSSFIGSVSFDGKSSWYNGRDKKMFFSMGAYIACMNYKLKHLWFLYYSLRKSKNAKISFKERLYYMDRGWKAFQTCSSFDEYFKV